MTGKILGIPLILVVTAILLAVLVDVPMFLMYRSESQRGIRMEQMVREVNMSIKVTPTPVITPVVITPKATIKTVTPKVGTQSSVTR